MIIEPTDTMIEEFGRAWKEEHNQRDGFSEWGDRRRAGLRAALGAGTPDEKRELARQLMNAARAQEDNPA